MSFIFVLLDTFVIPKSIQSVETEPTDTEKAAPELNKSAVVITDNIYKDENIKITIETYREYDTTIYVADVQLTDAAYLKTALAGNTYGRNITEKTSAIAAAHNAVLAVNGDYYGFRDYGYVLRNGTVYRNIARSAGDDEALLVDEEGNFSVFHESQAGIESLYNKNPWQIFSFGPALVKNGQIMVDSTSEISGKSMRSNPRTAIGQISSLHYIFIVSDGRTNESAGLSLFELAQEFKEKDCITAYNLDGGGSSTMYFNGEVINNPTDGRRIKEREVSDIVYCGY
ncbi:MAG TPA: phosphodiester glycosidase family protein [Syntrophomonadaceae bacterium]|nr:phosphodiester glycosidase family protein [Syntrophomonadaceae bacterium]HPR94602.1 phosphodiester glycosidase family protein [Syntrophomonadaceae bacterium]